MSHARNTKTMIQNYLNGTEKTSIHKLVYQKGIENPNEVMIIIFDIINDQLNQFDGTESLDRVITEIKQDSRRFAKRQYTFFNHQFKTKWFDVNFDNFNETIDDVVDYIKKEAN